MSQDRNSLEKLAEDVSKCAAVAGVSPVSERISRVLEVFGDGFAKHPVEFRTSTKPVDRRGMSFRFVDLDDPSRDPVAQAREAGLLEVDDHPVHALLPQVMEQCELAGWGVDAEVSRGLEKIWPFLAHGYPLSHISKLPALPPSASRIAPILEKHGMTHFSIVAADYVNRTCNLYFMLQDRSVPAVDNVRSLGEALGLNVDESLLEYMSHGVASNVTLNWDDENAVRFCIYVPGPTPDDVPPFPSPIPELVAQAPVVADHRSFIVGPTFTSEQSYIKLEVDWTGTILPCLQACMAIMPLAA